VFLAELPDKTMVATLLMTARTRRPLQVWMGVSVAFACHVVLAVVAGSLLSKLPDRAVAAMAGTLFAIGGIGLLRSSGDDATDEEIATPERLGGLRVMVIAELGDLTQLATAGLAANADQPWMVGIGAFAGLSAVAALAAGVGQALAQVVPLGVIRRVGGCVFLLLSGLAFVKVTTGA
jgi:putative Ca2+/H+ antiporter (TMEM165/GDT1 family)